METISHWAINMHYTWEKKPIAKDAKKVKVLVTSTLDNLGFQEDDSCLLLDKWGTHVEEDKLPYAFQKQGKIIGFDDIILKPLTDVEVEDNKVKKALGKPVKPQYIHGIDIEILNTIQRPVFLDDVALSLVSVYRYIHPEKHFQQQVRRLPKEDFETIVKNLVYVARTAFGKIANALPYENKLDFALLTMDRYKTVDFKSINFMEGLRFLFDYVHDNIISQGELLIATDDLLNAFFKGSELDVKEIGLIELDSVDEYGELKEAKPNLVSTQAELFRRLINIDKKSDFVHDIEMAIKENSEVEIRFHKIFSKASWPIDLTV
ncbi:MAG: hypothetical protein ACRYFZ_03555 [Janthinobacterium lividum]